MALAGIRTQVTPLWSSTPYWSILLGMYKVPVEKERLFCPGVRRYLHALVPITMCRKQLSSLLLGNLYKPKRADPGLRCTIHVDNSDFTISHGAPGDTSIAFRNPLQF